MVGIALYSLTFSEFSNIVLFGHSGYCDRSHNRFYRPVSIWPPEYLSTNLSRRKKNTDFNLLLAHRPHWIYISTAGVSMESFSRINQEKRTISNN